MNSPEPPGEYDHRRSICDQLLQTSADTESEHDVAAETEDLLGNTVQDPPVDEPRDVDHERVHKNRHERKAFFVRTVALLCACCLSVGSHYASNILGPLKSRLHRELGTSHTEFGLLLSAYSLNSTWTPLVGGLLASKLGTTFTSILATGTILLGQTLLLIGDSSGNIPIMVLGLFIFGMGVSPLAVVQETIIVRFFKSHGLGVSMAFGLIAGKGASFLAARTSYPLSEHFGPRAPFYVATALAALSVVVNLLYIGISKWLIDGAGAELEAPDITEEARRRLSNNLSEAQALEKVAKKRQVHIRQISKLGDVFWAYMLLNVFCGMIWAPFLHLSANIIEMRFGMSEKNSANAASYLLAGALFLYPICGYLVDTRKHRPIIIELLILSSILTLSTYIWFALPPEWTKSPFPAIFSFALGHGFSPLLLVVLVPRIVPSKYVSTALGAHKSMEQAGSTLLQTLAGLLLDLRTDGSKGRVLQRLLNGFVVLNLLQCGTILILALLQYRKNAAARRESNAESSTSDQEEPLLAGSHHHRYSTASSTLSSGGWGIGPSEIRRGKVLAILCVSLVITVWVLFMTTAWWKLGHRKKSVLI